MNASKEPARGWVITIFLSDRILPPPTGTSEVWASAAGPAAPPWPAEAPWLAGAADDELAWVAWLPPIPLLEL